MTDETQITRLKSSPALVVDMGTAGSGVLFDLSAAGMIVREAPLLVPGLFVTASFQLPGTGALIAPSYEVMWTKNANATLKLFSISEQDKRHLEDWLHRQVAVRSVETPSPEPQVIPVAAAVHDDDAHDDLPATAPERLPWFARVETPEPEEKGKSGWLLVALCVALVGVGGWAVTSAYLASRGPLRAPVAAPPVRPVTSVTPAAPVTSEPVAAAVPEPLPAAAEVQSPLPRAISALSQKPRPSPPAASTLKPTYVVPATAAPVEPPKPDPQAAVPGTTTTAAPAPTPTVVAESPAPARPIETAAPAAPPAQPVRVPAEVMEQYAISKPEPAYPAFARRARIEGPVILSVLVAADGGVKRIRVISGPPELAAGAADAVRQWRFRPYLLEGTPVEVQTELRFQFQAPSN